MNTIDSPAVTSSSRLRVGIVIWNGQVYSIQHKIHEEKWMSPWTNVIIIIYLSLSEWALELDRENQENTMADWTEGLRGGYNEPGQTWKPVISLSQMPILFPDGSRTWRECCKKPDTRPVESDGGQQDEAWSL